MVSGLRCDFSVWLDQINQGRGVQMVTSASKEPETTAADVAESLLCEGCFWG